MPNQPTIKFDHFNLNGPADQKMFFKMFDLLEKLTRYEGGFVMPPNNLFSNFKPRNYKGHPRSIRNVIIEMIMNKQAGDSLAADKLAEGTHRPKDKDVKKWKNGRWVNKLKHAKEKEKTT